jgi:hypothetical protein
MKRVRLALALLFFGSGFGLLGAFTTLDSGYPLYFGATIGGAYGLFIGAVFGGAKGTWVDYVYGPPRRSR